MDKIKELTKQKGLLERLVNNTSDEAELKKLGKEIDALNEEIMEAKADAKAEEKAAKIIEAKEKELEEKQVKEAKENKKPFVDIKITEAGEYKGVNLKRAVGLARMKNPIIDARANVNYADTEKVAKYMVDMVNGAMSNPSNKAMTEGTTTEGGYITPTEESMEMLHYVRESSVALQDATIIPMTTDTMTWPIENQKVAVSFRDEGSAVTAQSATFTQASLSTKNLDAYVPASKELVQDSPNLIAILMAQFGESVAKKVDSAAFVGTGSPVSGIFTAKTGYSEVFSTGSSNFSALLSSNIDALIGKVFATVQDTSKLKFYVHPSVAYRYFLSLKDDNGQYLYMRSQDGVGADKIWNYPVRFVYQAPSTTAASTGMFAFGDLSGLLIGERLNAMQLFYDPYTDAANGNDRFYWWTRWAFDYALPNKMGRAVTAS